MSATSNLCPAPAETKSSAQLADAYVRPEMKIRKLHLARPDLIPYPLAVEVYC